MTKIIIEQDLWDEDQEGVITAWLFDDGDQISTGDVVADVMVEKVQHEVLSSGTGTLKILKEAEQVINKGDAIGEVT